MKMWKKFLASLFTGIMLFSISVCSVFAAEQTGTTGKQYTYRVTIYAGIQGNFSGAEGLVLSNKNAVITQTEDRIVISGLNYGDEVAYTAQSDVKLDSTSKYYVQGIRLSGRDNDTVADSAFIVHSDVDYVVAYGIKGNQVSYTVNYYDEYGNAMLPSETFYGNVGDKPVIACKYVDGYAPQASGLTKTLQQNAAENVLTFEYRPIPGPTVEDVYTTVLEEEYVDVVRPSIGGDAAGGGTGTGSGNGAGGTTGTAGTAGGAGTAGTGNGEAGTGSETGGAENGDEGIGTNEGGNGTGETEDSASQDRNTEEQLIVDLDDEEVPRAMEPEENGQYDVSMVKYIVMIAAAAIALVILIIVVAMMKKRRNEMDKEV